MHKKRQLVTSNNCFEIGKVGLLRYSNEKHALVTSKVCFGSEKAGLLENSYNKCALDIFSASYLVFFTPMSERPNMSTVASVSQTC